MALFEALILSNLLTIANYNATINHLKIIVRPSSCHHYHKYSQLISVSCDYAQDDQIDLSLDHPFWKISLRCTRA